MDGLMAQFVAIIDFAKEDISINEKFKDLRG